MVSQSKNVEPTTPSAGHSLSATNLDEVDRALLAELLRDGRMSVRTLAERIHISRANAYSRLERLTSAGVIRGFTVRIDHERIGLGTSAFITVKCEQTTWVEFGAAVREIPEVEMAALVGGDFDYVLLVRTTDNASLRRVILNRIQTIEGVLSTRTMLIFEELVDR